MKKVIYGLFLCGLIGCGPKHIQGQPEDSTFLSPCIDGTILNMHTHGCDEFDVTTVPTEGYMDLKCGTARESTYWTAVQFRSYDAKIPTENYLVPAGWQLHCVDARTVMFVGPK